MRIAIFVSEDYDFTFDMMRNLIALLKKKHVLTGVASFPDRLGRYKGIGVYFAYLRIFGLTAFTKLVMRSLTKRAKILLDYIAGRCPFCSFGELYRYYGVSNIRLSNPNSREAIKWVRDNGIDVIVLFVGHILKREILESANTCVLNKHSSLLPAYKGILPVFWAMKNDNRIGVTIHKVSADVDGGEIVLQKAYEENAGLSVYDYYSLIYSDTPDLISESLELVEENGKKIYRHEIPPSSYGLPSTRDYREFRKKGHRFV